MNQLTLNCSGKLLDVSKPVVMGILNITPDSFYDGGKYLKEKDWLIKTEQMLREGAAIIDIGAISTRPGATAVSQKDEAKRLFPVLKSVRKKFPDAIISVDTSRASITKSAVELGADIINDISAGCFDDKMFHTITAINKPYIIMHIQGSPANMQKNPVYEDVLRDIIKFFSEKINKLKNLGINDIIIDPGFGFGKTVEHNYRLISRLEMFRIFGLPMLVGVSRKSMINKVLKINPADALNGTTVLNTIAILKGANILRVHDVKEAVQTIKIINEIKC